MTWWSGSSYILFFSSTFLLICFYLLEGFFFTFTCNFLCTVPIVLTLISSATRKSCLWRKKKIKSIFLEWMHKTEIILSTIFFEWTIMNANCKYAFYSVKIHIRFASFFFYFLRTSSLSCAFSVFYRETWNTVRLA